jgi:hypothetical protein
LESHSGDAEARENLVLIVEVRISGLDVNDSPRRSCVPKLGSFRQIRISGKPTLAVRDSLEFRLQPNRFAGRPDSKERPGASDGARARIPWSFMCHYHETLLIGFDFGLDRSAVEARDRQLTSFLNAISVLQILALIVAVSRQVPSLGSNERRAKINFLVPERGSRG